MSLPSFLSVGRVTLTITRHSGTYVNGRWAETAGSSFAVIANVQPTTSSTMVRKLPEGDRSKPTLAVFVPLGANKVRTSVEGVLQKGDTFTWQGNTYEVRQCDTYQMGVLDHQMIIAIRQEVA